MRRPAPQHVQISALSTLRLAQIFERAREAKPAGDVVGIEAQGLTKQRLRALDLAAQRHLARQTAPGARQCRVVLRRAFETLERVLELIRSDEKIAEDEIGASARGIEHESVLQSGERRFAGSACRGRDRDCASRRHTEHRARRRRRSTSRLLRAAQTSRARVPGPTGNADRRARTRRHVLPTAKPAIVC